MSTQIDLQAAQAALDHDPEQAVAASPYPRLAASAGDWPARMLLACRTGRLGGGRNAQGRVG